MFVTIHRVVAAVCLLAAGATQASLFYDFGPAAFGVAAGDTYDSLSMSVGGIGVTVEGVLIDNDDAGNVLSVTTLSGTTPAGTNLGVYVSSSANNIGVVSSDTDSHHIDGGSFGDTTDPDEGIRLVFSEAVTLGRINFDSWNNLRDDFNLRVDGIDLVTDYYSGRVPGSTLITDDLLQDDYFHFNHVAGTEFIFWADSDSDGFRIDDLTLVPSPGVLALLSIGLFGWRVSRR